MPCKYLVKWETEMPWLKSVKDAPDRAYCKLCMTDFSVSSSGVSQVNSHAKGSKHAEILFYEIRNLTSFWLKYIWLKYMVQGFSNAKNRFLP